MKVFVATAAGQGARPSDENGCLEGDSPSRRQLADAWAASTVIGQQAANFGIDQIVERRGWTIQARRKKVRVG